jgi:hypothetical protein
METIDYKKMAKMLGVNVSTAWRTCQQVIAGTFGERNFGYYQAIYALTGKTPNDLIPYKKRIK